MCYMSCIAHRYNLEQKENSSEEEIVEEVVEEKQKNERAPELAISRALKWKEKKYGKYKQKKGVTSEGWHSFLVIVL